ncbi:uncharacterized protein LOC106994621 isoform X4 [Macaca mulatta]
MCRSSLSRIYLLAKPLPGISQFILPLHTCDLCRDEETEASAACPRSCGCSGGQTSKIKVSTGLRSFLEETGNLHPSPVPCLCPMLVVSSEEGFSELQKAFWVL